MSTIKKKLWLLDSFTSLNNPSWTCPSCYIGTLIFTKNWYQLNRTAEAQKQSDEYLAYHPESDLSHYTGVLKCSHKQCGENVVTTGIAYECPVWIDQEDPQPTYLTHFKSVFFLPSIHIFDISKQCPKDIEKQIRLSFSHYFNDTSAAANSARTALEMILDHQKVSKIYLVNHKRKSHTLHRRIELFGQSKPEIKPFLLAAKWIGNAGSHLGDVSKEAILDGYELLEHCIDELYHKPHRIKELTSKAKSINKKRKPTN